MYVPRKRAQSTSLYHAISSTGNAFIDGSGSAVNFTRGGFETRP